MCCCNIDVAPYLFFHSQIIIFGFPPHTTHILQPLDVGIFNHMKKYYNHVCIGVGQRNSRAVVTKSYFPSVWQQCVEKGCTKKIIKSAFQRSGIYPFDPTAVDESKIIDNTK